MKPGFEITSDLVRFRIRLPEGYVDRAVLMDEITMLAGAEEFDGPQWTFGRPPLSGFTDVVCPKESAPKVLAILEKHGIEKVEALG